MKVLEWEPVMKSNSGSKRVVLLLSGGLDSATLLSLYDKKGYEIFPISFEYGQTHAKELESMRVLCRHYGLSPRVVKIDLSLAASSLVGNGSIESRGLDEIKDGLPSTFVPSRNIIFLSVAASYAYSIYVNSIAIGVNSLDYSGYPDCRPEFIASMERTINIGLNLSGKMIIEAPLQYLDKRQIIELGISNSAHYEMSWSCYRGESKACGKCDSCLLRLKGFMEAGLEDPIEYAEFPEFYMKWMENKKKGKIKKSVG